MKHLLKLLLCFVLLCFGASEGRAQQGLLEYRGRGVTDVIMRVVVDRQGGATVLLDREGGDALLAASSPALVDRAIAQSIGGSVRPLGWAAGKTSASWSVARRSDDWLHRTGLHAQGVINPDPLRPLLRAAHLLCLIVEVSPRDTPNFSCSLRSRRRMRNGAVYYLHNYIIYPANYDAVMRRLGLPSQVRTPITVRAGYRFPELAGAFAPFALLLFLPLGVTFWMRARALRAISAAEVDSATVLFGFGRFLQQTAIVVWLLWLPLDYGLGLQSILAFFWDGPKRIIPIPFLSYYLPAMTSIACTMIAAPVFRKVWDEQFANQNVVRDSVLALAQLLPLVFYSVAASYFLDRPTEAVVWMALGLAARQIVRRFGRKTVLRVTGGNLFEKAQQFAQASGLPPAVVIILPGGAGSFANAFATTGNRVLLTKYLVDSLSRREVDAIMAHEMTHLKYKHPLILGATYVLAAGASIGAALWAGLLHAPAVWVGVIQSAVLAATLLGQMMLGRVFERAADAGALKLTGDAEACISGLGKIARLNRTPMEWGKWDRYWLTHPSTAQRFREIAQRGGLTEEQVAAAMRAAGAETTEERYQINVRSSAESAPAA